MIQNKIDIKPYLLYKKICFIYKLAFLKMNAAPPPQKKIIYQSKFLIFFALSFPYSLCKISFDFESLQKELRILNKNYCIEFF